MNPRRPIGASLFINALCGVLSACSSAAAIRCVADARPAITETLYFGTDTPSGTVSAREWTDFVDSVVTPRFPRGLTQWTADGQWRSAAGPIIQEGSHVLTLIHPQDVDSDRSVRAVMDRYKTTFHQEAVLRVQTAACASY